MTRIRSVIGHTLSLLLAATCFCAFAGVVIAAQSATFVLTEAGPGHGAGVPAGSPTFQLQGDLSWRQEAPLHSDSFSITVHPPLPTSASAASSSSFVVSVASSSVRDESGGHRGDGTTTTNPPSSRRSSSPRSSSTSRSVTSATSSAVASSVRSDISASSEPVRPAAPDASSSSVGSENVCASVLCPAPFYRRVELVPVPGGYEAHSPMVDAIRATVTACSGSPLSLLLFFLFFALGVLVTVLFFLLGSRRTNAIRAAWYAVLFAAAVTTFTFLCIQTAQAAVSSPQRHVYNGHLLNAAGQAITTPHYIRFSEWYSRDMVTGDVAAGAINTGAATYAGYQEVFVVTPDAQGYFSVQLGTGASLPDLAGLAASDLDNLFLQVEVKAAGNPDTAYELLDVNPSDSTIDRSPILSVPFAQNADLLDQREIGTGSGSIPLLGSGGLLPVATVPGGTNRNTFTVDSDNTAADLITLQFGQALAKTLSYDIVNDRFTFNADVRIEGDLTVTGLINGVDITNISGGDAGKLRVSSGAGLTINVTGGAYRINGDVTDYAGASGVAVPANATSQVFIGSGGLTVRTSGFPTDESFIRLAEVVTNGAVVTQVSDFRVTLSDDREHPTEVNLHAEFPNASYQADATENTGQLSVSLDNITLRNFYLWSSTRTTLQDYDVVVRVSLPADFVRWDSAPLSVSYRTTSADALNSKVDVSVFDTNGTPVTLGGSATGLASTSWGTSGLTFGGAPTWTAGQEFLVKFKLHAKDNFQAHVGSMKLKYVRLTP